MHLHMSFFFFLCFAFLRVNAKTRVYERLLRDSSPAHRVESLSNRLPRELDQISRKQKLNKIRLKKSSSFTSKCLLKMI